MKKFLIKKKKVEVKLSKTSPAVNSPEKNNLFVYDNDLIDEFSTIKTSTGYQDVDEKTGIKKSNAFKYFCITFIVVFCIIGVLFTISFVGSSVVFVVTFVLNLQQVHQIPCTKSCNYNIIESIPQDMLNISFKGIGMQSHEAVIKILNESKRSVKMLQFYFELENNAHPLAYGNFGNEVFKAIVNASVRHGNVEIIYNKPGGDIQYSKDMKKFEELKGVMVRTVDFNKLFGGVLHTKLIIVDDKSFILASVNMDWKSFSQVKEIGIFVEDCICITNDLVKIFNIFKDFHDSNNNFNDLKRLQIKYETYININNPIKVNFSDSINNENSNGTLFFSASPKGMNSHERTNDINALVYVINTAIDTINLSVMDFWPVEYYKTPKIYWSELDSAIKSAVMRNVTVNLLISKWNYTSDIQIPYLKSLKEFSKFCYNDTNKAWCVGEINIKLFIIPNNKEFTPYNFTRVCHAKYVTTDNKSYISTSNFSKDFFYSTAGISVTLSHSNVRKKLRDIFNRDWNSAYSHDLENF